MPPSLEIFRALLNHINRLDTVHLDKSQLLRKMDEAENVSLML